VVADVSGVDTADPNCLPAVQPAGETDRVHFDAPGKGSVLYQAISSEV
jgi:hypothetical protein